MLLLSVSIILIILIIFFTNNYIWGIFGGIALFAVLSLNNMESAKFRTIIGSKEGVEGSGNMNKKVIIFNGYWNPSIVKTHSDWLFIYGDNDLHVGKGGQAVIRDLPNAMGIATKKEPDDDPESFYTDSEINLNMKKIDKSIKKIRNAMKKYTTLVLPKDGLGTGLAQLDKKAPKTFEYLQSQIKKLAEYVQPGSSRNILNGSSR